MKNKAFTLVELMAIIIIIGVIATIAVPNVTNAIKISKQKSCEKQKEMIIDAAKRWATDNRISNSNVSIETLKTEGYIKNEDIKNPLTKKNMTGEINITYNSTYNQYIYTYDDLSSDCS